jgi:hypothetical protein
VPRPLDNTRWAFLISLIVAGVICLGTGLVLIINGDIDYDNAINSSFLKPIPVNDSRIDFVTNSSISYVISSFNTTDTFSASRPFDVTMNVTTANLTAYDKIVVVPLDATVNMTTLKKHTVFQNFIDYDNKTGHLITLLPDNKTNSFNGSLKQMQFTSEGDLIFMLAPYKNGKFIQEIPILKGHPIKIYPVSAQYQTDTDRDIRKQNIETAKSNSHVEGLTFVIIGLVLLGYLLKQSSTEK